MPKSKRALEAERQKLAKRMYQKDLGGELSPEKKARLDSMMDLITERMKDAPEDDTTVIKGVTEKIDTLEPQKVKSIPEWKADNAMKMQALKKLGSKGLKALPIVGALGSALASGDVSAAVPVLSEADDLGPLEGSLEAVVEDPSKSMEERIKVIRMLKERNR